MVRAVHVDLVYPRRSMYAIYASIDPQNHPNVVIYTAYWSVWV